MALQGAHALSVVLRPLVSAFWCTRVEAAFRDRISLFEKEPQMDDIIANLGLYALAAFAVGFVFAWITCAKVEQ